MSDVPPGDHPRTATPPTPEERHPVTVEAHQVVPTWPQIIAIVYEDGRGEVTVDGDRHSVTAADLAAARTAVLAHISTTTAAELRRAVRIDTFDPEGQWQMIVHPDGRVEAAEDGAPATTPQRREKPSPARGARPGRPGTCTRVLHVLEEPPAPVPVAPADDMDQTGVHDLSELRRGLVPSTPPLRAAAAPPDLPPAAPAQPEVPDPVPSAPPTLRDLLAARPARPPAAAQWGWQGAVRRLSRDLAKPGPGPAELAHRAAVAAVQRRLDGPKTVVVVNPKGGAHKTTAALLIAATFGTHRGGYTLAWDNNETRGTMGWRAHPAGHSSTALDLLHELPRLSGVNAVRVGDLDDFVRPQDWGHFDVLASDEDAVSAGLIDAAAFDRLHASLSCFYRVMVVDTGNNMRAANWQAALEAADQLVIVSTIREDTAQSAAWLADALRATGKEDLVAGAVTVLTAPAQASDAVLGRRLQEHFTRLTRAVLTVPHDASLVAGGPIAYDALSTHSREAWLRVTAAITDGL
jgi:MinD-like ATPase involved in chromosome partitioning or flagellar assembly